ncbi:ATP-binding cassette sub- F member 3 [Chamberlinius hualienensis]
MSAEAVIRAAFPSIDDEIFSYVTGILEGNTEDFRSADDIYEAVGAFLHEVAGDVADEYTIRSLCQDLHNVVKVETDVREIRNGLKRLDHSVDLRHKVKEQESSRLEGAGGLLMVRGNVAVQSVSVNSKKLEKAEARLKEKQAKRLNEITDKPSIDVVLDDANVSQAISKKESRQEAKGTNNTKDIRIENFDVSYKDKVLIREADVLLAYGRRYGLVGRNGLGKTTLLRAISSSQLRIPSHVTVLHVEQEVVGDDTKALESVLQCDEVRERLLKEEAELSVLINNQSGNAADEGLSSKLAQVYEQLQHIEADKAPSKASVILFGLGFDAEMQQRATREFSGGWRMRLALARALFSQPDLLLLDEPTNMLDIKAIIWLESYLQSWPSTLLVVSHDRHFLNIVPTDTEKIKNQLKEFEAQQQLRAHVQEFIDRFRYNANRAALVQSKIKMLEKLPELKPVEKELEVVFKFPNPEKLNPPIIQLDEVSFSYTPGRKILCDVNLSANMESRICIVGENGAGKSTLLKILTGTLSPISGIYHCHRNLRIGYFSQHHVDQLDLTVSSVELLASRYPGHPAEYYRQQLGRFGVSGDLALQLVASLSGGQKSRVAFASMTMNNPNFLVLDEPTNHLDVETIDALSKAINKYQGGVVLVSHDETLIRKVCSELWVCSNGTVKSIEGGFDEYREMVKQELKSQIQKK